MSRQSQGGPANASAWWWLSFVVAGTFRGAFIVEAPTIDAAVTAAIAVGAPDTAEVMPVGPMDLDEADLVALGPYLRRRLSAAECAATELLMARFDTTERAQA